MATVDAMKVANKEMKKQYKGIDIDKIEVSLQRGLLFMSLSAEYSLRHGGLDRTGE